MISSLVKDRRHWSKFKDDKDVSSAQRKQDLNKIALAAAPGEETSIPKPWMPKWMKEKMIFEAEEAKLQADALAAEADGGNNNNLAPVAKVKPRLNIVLIGPSNGGKSTIFGHLKLRFGRNVTKKTMINLEKKAMEQGKGNKKFAWVSDTTKVERDRDSTVTLSRSEIISERFSINVTDIPSQRNFLKTSLHGISQADAVVLVLSATEIDFNNAFHKYSIMHDHLFACIAYGIRQIVVVINKMDQIQYSQEIFQQREDRIVHYLIDVIGFIQEGITVIPIVATVGDNMFPSEPKNKKIQRALLIANENMPWYSLIEPSFRAVGTTLIERIDDLVAPPSHALTKLPMIVYDVGKGSTTNSPINSPFASPKNSPTSTPREMQGVTKIGFKDGTEKEEKEEKEGKEEKEEKKEPGENKEKEEKQSDRNNNSSNESSNSDDDDDDNENSNNDTDKDVETNVQNTTPTTTPTTTPKTSPKTSPRSNKSSKSSKFPTTRRGNAFRMPVSEVYRTSAGTIAVGRIVSGSIGCFEQIRVCPGPLDYENILADDDHDDTLIIPEEETDEEIEIRLALGEVAKIKTIQIWNKSIPKRSHVRRGDYVGLKLAARNVKVGQRKGRKNVTPLVRSGTVLGSFGIHQYPVRTVKEFHASIILFNLPCGNNETSLGISIGWSPIIDVHTAHVQCRMIEIILNKSRGKDDRVAPDIDPFADENRGDSRASRRTRRNKGKRNRKKKVIEEDDEEEELVTRKTMIKTGDCVDVRMVPFRPLVVEPFNVCPALSRFVLRDGNKVVGCGIVKSVKFGMHQGSANVLESSSSDEEDSDEDEDENEDNDIGSDNGNETDASSNIS